MAEALVLDLGWDPQVAAAMAADELHYWVDAAIRRKKRREQGGGS